MEEKSRPLFDVDMDHDIWAGVYGHVNTIDFKPISISMNGAFLSTDIICRSYEEKNQLFEFSLPVREGNISDWSHLPVSMRSSSHFHSEALQ